LLHLTTGYVLRNALSGDFVIVLITSTCTNLDYYSPRLYYNLMGLLSYTLSVVDYIVIVKLITVLVNTIPHHVKNIIQHDEVGIILANQDLFSIRKLINKIYHISRSERKCFKKFYNI
jgi:hypothetical protein